MSEPVKVRLSFAEFGAVGAVVGALISIAVTLKRIADALEMLAK